MGWGLTLTLTLATYAGAALSWSHLARAFPQRTRRPSQDVSTTHWVDEGVSTLAVQGNLADARILAIGDSRTWTAVNRGVLDASSLGPSAVLWGSGGDLRILLDEAAELSPEILVVGLSPHALGPAPSPIYAIVAREKFPVFRPHEASLASVRRWRRSEHEHLLAENIPENLANIYLDRLQNQFLREHKLFHHATARWEARVDAWAQRYRFDHVYTVQTSRWRKSWLAKNDPTMDAASYRRRLKADHFAEGKETFRQQVIDRLRIVAAKMPTVVVRFPLSAEVREAEDESASPEWLAEIAKQAGVPYVDYGTMGATFDGSHVTTDTASWLTADLVERLEGMDLELVDD